jgi:hypothetical protein
MGALGTGSWLGQYWTQRAARRNRLEEKSQDRDEKHREDLIKAYSDFVGTYEQFIDAAADFSFHHRQNIAIAKHLADSPPDDEVVPITAALVSQVEKSLARLSELKSATRTKAALIVLIDDDHDRRERVAQLQFVEFGSPDEEYDQLVTEVRRQFMSMKDSLGGVFSPDRWHAEISTQRALPAGKFDPK